MGREKILGGNQKGFLQPVVDNMIELKQEPAELQLEWEGEQGTHGQETMEDVGQRLFIRRNEERDIQEPMEGHVMAGAKGKQKEKKWNNAKLF